MSSLIFSVEGFQNQDRSGWRMHLNGNQCFISVINQIEILGFDGQPDTMRLLEELVGELSIIPLTDAVVQATISIRKQYKMKLPDAIIAATCLRYDFTLLTHNTKDFSRLTSLNLLDVYGK
ncbi:MAG: type II toxin-antitoxin system VapC family toxin [Bacteroidota bacterium]